MKIAINAYQTHLKKNRRKSLPTMLARANPSIRLKNYHGMKINVLNTYFIPKRTRWIHLKDLNHDIGAELIKEVEAIQEYNNTLEEVLASKM